MLPGKGLMTASAPIDARALGVAPSMIEARMGAVPGSSEEAMAEQVRIGMYFLESRWGKKYEKLGALANDPSKMLLAAQTALILEMQDRYIEGLKRRLGEATVIAKFGDITPRILDIVRIGYPNYVIHELAQVQVMLSWVDSIFYVKPVFATTARGMARGQSVIESDSQNYADEICTDNIATGNGSTLTFSKSALSYVPIRGGTLMVTVNGTPVGQDDGNGVIYGAQLSGTNTIAYDTGAITVTFGAGNAPASGVAVDVEYRYDSEQSNSQLGGVDIVFAHYPVQARIHPIEATWSVSAGLAASANLGVEIEDVLSVSIGQFLKAERDRACVADMIRGAGGYWPKLSFDADTGTDDSFWAHVQMFKLYLGKIGPAIISQVRRGQLNWLVHGTDVAGILGMIEGYVAEPNPVAIGIYRNGTLQGYPTYTNPYMKAGDFLGGFKGTIYGDAGYILAEYIPIYETPTLEFSNFQGKKGIASFYDKKLITPEYFKLGQVTNIP